MFGRKKDVYEADDSPFYKQRSWVFSAVFLATVVFVSSLAYLTGSDGGSDDAAAPPRKTVKGPLSTEDSKDRAPSDDERPKGCDTGDEDAKYARISQNPQAAIPKAAPKDTAWKSLGLASVPTSPTAGPTRYNGAVWWCYSRTPTGAVMAAHSILTHMSSADWRDVAEQQIVAGEGRDSFIEGRSHLPQSDAESQEPGVYTGFQVASYSKNAANVRILIKSSGGTLGTTTVSMRWSGGDWKVKPRANGELFSTTTGGGDGFVRWGAA